MGQEEVINYRPTTGDMLLDVQLAHLHKHWVKDSIELTAIKKCVEKYRIHSSRANAYESPSNLNFPHPILVHYFHLVFGRADDQSLRDFVGAPLQYFDSFFESCIWVMISRESARGGEYA